MTRASRNSATSASPCWPGIRTSSSASFKQHRNPIEADQIGDAQGVIVLTPAITAQSVAKPDSLLVMARFGVGYDNVDVKACTDANVLVTITVGAVDRPVAEATVGWMIALSHNMLAKDALVRTGQWNERAKYMGCELRERALGVIGLGGIARKTIELLGELRHETAAGLRPVRQAGAGPGRQCAAGAAG